MLDHSKLFAGARAYNPDLDPVLLHIAEHDENHAFPRQGNLTLRVRRRVILATGTLDSDPAPPAPRPSTFQPGITASILVVFNKELEDAESAFL